jgi:hypothetical protein
VERAKHQTLIVNLSQVHVGQCWRSSAHTFRIGKVSSQMQGLQVARHPLAD